MARRDDTLAVAAFAEFPAKTAVRKLGNAAGVIILKSVLAEFGLSAGDAVDLRLEDGRLILAPVRPPSRAGWADASRAIAEAGDDTLLLAGVRQRRRRRPGVVTRSAIVAPMRTGSHPAPFRIAMHFQGKHGLILLDQLRTLDKQRLVRRLGSIGAGAPSR